MDHGQMTNQDAFWLAMLNKYEQRNMQLQQDQCNLKHHLEAMQCSMPAALMYTMNRKPGEANQINMVNFMSGLGKSGMPASAVSSVNRDCPCGPCTEARNKSKSHSNVPSSSSCTCDPCDDDQVPISTPSSALNSDSCTCAPDAKQSYHSNSLTCTCDPCEAPKPNVTSAPSSCSCEPPPGSIAGTNRAQRSKMPDNCCESAASSQIPTNANSSCTYTPCSTPQNASHMGGPNMMDKLSLFSLESTDLLYMTKLQELANREKQMKYQLEELEHREQAYLDTLRQADEMWACLECCYKERLSDVQQNGDSVRLKFEKMNEQLMEENAMLVSELKDAKLELKQCMEKVQGPIHRQLEQERRKSEQLENELLCTSKNMATKECAFMKNMNDMQNQLNCSCKTLCEINCENERLKKEICTLQCKYTELQKDLINQKLSEAHTLQRLNETLCMDRSMGGQRSNRQEPVSIYEDDTLCGIARRLSQTLTAIDECRTCQSIPPDLVDTVHGIKGIVDLVDQANKKDTESCCCSCHDGKPPGGPHGGGSGGSGGPKGGSGGPGGPNGPGDDKPSKIIGSRISFADAEPQDGPDVEGAKESGVEEDTMATVENTIDANIQFDGGGDIEIEIATAKASQHTSGISSSKEIKPSHSTCCGAPCSKSSEASRKRPSAPSSAECCLAVITPSRSKPSRVSIQEPWKVCGSAVTASGSKGSSRGKGGGRDVQILTEVQTGGNVEVDIETEVNLTDTVSDGINITTTITGSGMLEVITEGPAGVIETTMTYTKSGNIEVTTEITEYGDHHLTPCPSPRRIEATKSSCSCRLPTTASSEVSRRSVIETESDISTKDVSEVSELDTTEAESEVGISQTDETDAKASEGEALDAETTEGEALDAETTEVEELELEALEQVPEIESQEVSAEAAEVSEPLMVSDVEIEESKQESDEAELSTIAEEVTETEVHESEPVPVEAEEVVKPSEASEEPDEVEAAPIEAEEPPVEEPMTIEIIESEAPSPFETPIDSQLPSAFETPEMSETPSAVSPLAGSHAPSEEPSYISDISKEEEIPHEEGWEALAGERIFVSPIADEDRCRDVCSPSYVVGTETVCQDLCARAVKTGNVAEGDVFSEQAVTEEPPTAADMEEQETFADAITAESSEPSPESGEPSITRSDQSKSERSPSKIPIPIKRHSKSKYAECDCHRCDCEICSPKIMKEREGEIQKGRKKPHDCTCIPDCTCAVCAQVALKQCEAATSLDSAGEPGELGSSGRGRTDSLCCTGHEPGIPPDCDCVECVCTPCGSYPEHFRTRVHPPDCDCLTCLCDPCGHVGDQVCISHASRESSREHSKLLEGKGSQHVPGTPPDCDCPECVCEPCGAFPADYKTREHAPDCDCVMCLCDPCGHDGDQPCVEEPKEEKPLSKIAYHPEGCDCEVCKCCTCSGKNAELPPSEPPSKLAFPPEICKCDTCECIEGIPPVQREKPLPSIPSALPTDIATHQVNCECLECSLIRDVCPDSQALKEARKLQTEEPLGKLVFEHPADCECADCLCDTVFPRVHHKNPLLFELLKKDNDHLEHKIDEIESERLLREQEMEELQTVMEQIQCSCYEAEMQATRSMTGDYKGIDPGLEQALTCLQEKCKEKDRLIEAMLDELKLSADSKVFNEILTKLAVEADFDPTKICKSSCSKRKSTTGRTCSHPNFPDCPCTEDEVIKITEDEVIKITEDEVIKITDESMPKPEETIQETDDPKYSLKDLFVCTPNSRTCKHPDFPYCPCGNAKKSCPCPSSDDSCSCVSSKTSPTTSKPLKPCPAPDGTCPCLPQRPSSSPPRLSSSQPKTSFKTHSPPTRVKSARLASCATPCGTCDKSKPKLTAGSCQEIGMVPDSSPMEITEVRKIAADSLIVKWLAPANKSVTGYEVLVDGEMKSKVRSADRTSAVLDTLRMKETVNISIFAITKSGRCQPAAKAIYQM